MGREKPKNEYLDQKYRRIRRSVPFIDSAQDIILIESKVMEEVVELNGIEPMTSTMPL